MLSEEVIDKVVERLVNRIEQGNIYVLEQIGKNIKKIGTLSPSKAQQLAQILKYGGDYDKITKKLAEITELNVKDIQKIFEEVAKSDYAFAKQFYDYRGIKYIPYEENMALKNQVNAIAKATALKYINIANTSAMCVGMVDDKGTTTIKLLKDAYYDIIDETALNVAQGKETFESAMYRQIKEIGSGGLKVIFPTTYWGKDGEGMPVLKNRVMRFDSSIRMLMDNALGQMHQETQETIGKQFGYDGYEISVHSAPAPDHQFIQGKQFSIEEFDKFQNDEDAVSYDGVEFPSVSEETGHDRRAIYEYNCKHYTFSIVLGVSKPLYSNEKLKEIIDRNEKGFEYEGKHFNMYEGTQLQRQIELEIRKAKDEQIMGREAGIMENVDKAQQRIKALTKKYKEVLEASKLPSRLERARVSGYKRVAIKKKK